MCRDGEKKNKEKKKKKSKASTYKELLWCRALVWLLVQALLNHVFQNAGEGVALGESWSRLVHNLLQEVQNARWSTVFVRELFAGAERELANG